MGFVLYLCMPLWKEHLDLMHGHAQAHLPCFEIELLLLECRQQGSTSKRFGQRGLDIMF